MEWLAIVPILLCCGLPLVVLILFGRHRNDGPPERRL